MIRTLQLQCAHCRQKFSLTPLLKNNHQIRFGILSCHCGIFPLIETIPVLSYESPIDIETITKKLQEEKFFAATSLLVGEKFYTLFLISRFLRNFFKVDFGKILFLYSLVFPANQSWYQYVKTRPQSTTFAISKNSWQLLSKTNQKGIVVDLGCGTGNFLDFVANMQISNQVVGIDNSLRNLLLALLRLEQETLLICDNVETSIPLSQKVSAFFMHESLGYIQNKKQFLQTLKKQCRKHGQVIITVAHNEGFNIPSLPITPHKLVKISPFHQNMLYKDQDLLQNPQHASPVSAKAIIEASYSFMARNS